MFSEILGHFFLSCFLKKQGESQKLWANWTANMQIGQSFLTKNLCLSCDLHCKPC
jgi:hypothetical protein